MAVLPTLRKTHVVEIKPYTCWEKYSTLNNVPRPYVFLLSRDSSTRACSL